MSYCTADDLYARLGEGGVLFAADDDGDGACSPGESGRSLAMAIAAADSEIDAALASRLPLPIDMPNEWLRHRAVDLACEYLMQRRGGDTPKSVADAASRSRAWLEEIRVGKLVPPGVMFRGELASRERSRGLPRLSNPLPSSEQRCQGRRRLNGEEQS